MDFWRLVYRFSGSLLAVLVGIGVVLAFSPRVHNIAELQREKHALELENSRLKAELADIRERQRRFTTEPAYVERIAREIGMVRPGETVYVFTNRTGRPPREPGGAMP